MLTLKGKTLRILLITAMVWLSGCEAENPVGEGNKITGTVYDGYGFPVSNNIVNIGNQQPYYLTQADGKFSFDIQSIPYSAKINNVVMYKNLSSKNINLIGFESRRNYKTIYIKTPKVLNNDQVGFLKFLSNEINYSEDNYLFSTDSITPLTVAYPITNSSIEGKIIFLSIAIGSGGIESYDHYGEKNVTLTQYSADTILFKENEINYNPPECKVTINIISEIPQSTGYIFYLNFKDFKYTSAISVIGFASNAKVFNFIEPSLLNEPFELKVSTIQSIQDPPYAIKKNLILDPCISGSIVMPDKHISQYPEDNQTDVSLNTNFIFESESPPGIFEFNFLLNLGKGFQGIAKVYTDKNILNLGELRASGFEFLPQRIYSWYVVKYIGFNSINEFVEKPFYEERNPNGAITSTFRNFTTGSLK